MPIESNIADTHAENNILLVDDSKLVINLVSRFLEQSGYCVITAFSGAEGLEKARKLQPNLILLDVIMPDLNGFDVCTQLQQSEETAHIPIIFLTAETDTDSMVQGFDVGAVDYIKKPINPKEALARVRTHLKLQKLQVGLEKGIAQREALIADLSAFTHMVAHDLKNPLSTIMGFADLMQESYQQGDIATIETALPLIQQSGQKAYQIIDGLLLLANVRLKDVEYTAVNPHLIILEAMARLREQINDCQAKISYPTEWPTVIGFEPWLEEVWVNLISNAIKYGGALPEINLGFEKCADSALVKFFVTDNGAGLSEEEQAKLFTPFVRLHKKLPGHGLGLSNVSRIIEKLGGQVSVESHIGKGTTFFFTLPAA